MTATPSATPARQPTPCAVDSAASLYTGREQSACARPLNCCCVPRLEECRNLRRASVQLDQPLNTWHAPPAWRPVSLGEAATLSSRTTALPGSRGGAMARLAVRDGAIEVEAKVDPGGESDTQFRRSTP